MSNLDTWTEEFVSVLPMTEFLEYLRHKFPNCMRQRIITITPKGPRVTREDFYDYVKNTTAWHNSRVVASSDEFGFMPFYVEGIFEDYEKGVAEKK